MNAADYINRLQLLPHPEGGYYKETYRATGTVTTANGLRSYSTAIYYLLEQGDYSAFHRLKSDEGWHFYAGGTLLIHLIDEGGNYRCINLGNDVKQDEVPQYVIPAGTWLAAEPAPSSSFTLVGCTVAPGFDFEDFEMRDKNQLRTQFPQSDEIICRLCR